MRFIERHDVVRASFILLLIPLLAAIGGCDGDPSPSGSTGGGSPGGGGTGGTGGMGGTNSTATGGDTGGTGMGGVGGAGGTGGTGMGCTGGTGAGGTTGAGTGGGGAFGGTALVAVIDDTTPYDQNDPMGLLQNDKLTVFDPANPNPPLLELSGLKYDQTIGSWRMIATSKSKKRLGIMEISKPPALRVFDENLQELVSVVLPNDMGAAIYPTEQAIFALTSKETINTGTITKLDSNGSIVASTVAFHGVDLVVDEDRQVVWSAGQFLTRADTDLLNEQKLHTFGWAAVSVDVDASGGVWAAERQHPSVPGSADQLVHFDVNGNLLSGDTLALPGSPMSVRVDRNSGRVWVAMILNGGVAYRDVNGQLNMVPGLTGWWTAVEPDPLDCSRVWAAQRNPGQVVHVDTNGTVIQSLGGFSTSQKGLAVMLQGQ
jgi:hypothetical protein